MLCAVGWYLRSSASKERPSRLLAGTSPTASACCGPDGRAAGRGLSSFWKRSGCHRRLPVATASNNAQLWIAGKKGSSGRSPSTRHGATPPRDHTLTHRGAQRAHPLGNESPSGPRGPSESSPPGRATLLRSDTGLSAADAPGRPIRRPNAGEPNAGCESRRPPGSLRPAPCEPATSGQNRLARLRAAPSRAVAPARHAAAVVLVVVAVLLAVSTAAQTPTYVFVSNSTEPGAAASDAYQAQSFTTGPYDAGATITQFRLWVVDEDGLSTRVTIRENNASNEPGDLVATLTHGNLVAGSWNIFFAPSGMTLDASTTYWITVNDGVASDRVSFRRTTGHGEYGYATGWSIGNSRLSRNDETADWVSSATPLYFEVRGPVPSQVTIEPNHPSIGAGIEDLVFTLTRTGATTDELVATVTIVQDQFWLDTSDLSHTVTFVAGSPTATLTLNASSFSFAPDTAGELTAAVTGAGISGGSTTVEMISTADPPITISYDMSAYTFAENATDTAVYLVATLDAAYPREPSRNYFVTFSTRSGTAKADNDYAPISERESFTRSEYGRDADTDPFVARKLLSDFGFALVDDAIYEGSERLGLIMEGDHPPVVGMAAFQKPDGTTCEPFVDCPNPPFEYPVTITDEGDLPALLLSVVLSLIAEEDDDGTTDTAENVSTVTVEITNGKTFAVDQTVTLTFSGTATQGTHYSVSPGDADPNTAGHQVVLRTGDSSVEVTVTATGNDTADRNRTVTVAADLDGTAIGSRDITILDDETPLSTDATLSALALSGVTLAPTFVSATEDYTATVVNAVMQTTVTATPTHSGATVAFKDGDDTALTNPVTLAVGVNVIKAVVTAEDTTIMKTYMVTVTREGTTDHPRHHRGGAREHRRGRLEDLDSSR